MRDDNYVHYRVNIIIIVVNVIEQQKISIYAANSRTNI